MRKPLLKARQLLLLAYLLTAVLWVVRCLVGCGVMLNYKLQGKMPQTHVDAAELVTESFAPYSSNEWWTPPDNDPAWYLSTDSDPHIYWQGQGYIETVVLDAAIHSDEGGDAQIVRESVSLVRQNDNWCMALTTLESLMIRD